MTTAYSQFCAKKSDTVCVGQDPDKTAHAVVAETPSGELPLSAEICVGLTHNSGHHLTANLTPTGLFANNENGKTSINLSFETEIDGLAVGDILFFWGLGRADNCDEAWDNSKEMPFVVVK